MRVNLDFFAPSADIPGDFGNLPDKQGLDMTDNGARAPENIASDPDAMVSTGPGQPKPGATEAGATGDSAAALAKEAADMRDRWMRAMAEMENLRRRTEREVADARTYSIAGFARDIVRGKSRCPTPPPRITARTLFIAINTLPSSRIPAAQV